MSFTPRQPWSPSISDAEFGAFVRQELEAKNAAKVPRCLGKGVNCKVGTKGASWCYFHEDMTGVTRSLNVLSNEIEVLRRKNPPVGSGDLSRLIELEARERTAHAELKAKWPHLFTKQARRRANRRAA